MAVIPDIWTSFLHIIKDEVGSRVVETWFKAVSLVEWDNTRRVVYLCAPNSFVRDWICNNYMPLIQTHLCRLLHVDQLKVICSTPDKKESLVPDDHVLGAVPVPVPLAAQDKPVTAIRSQGHVNKNYSFDSFVVGPSNSLSYAAAQAVTERPGTLYNPLFIYGGSGLGKTHLLHAIGNEMKKRHAQTVVLYQPADRFVSEFIHAIRFDKIHKFQAKYQAVDVLLIDDIQFISNKEQTQEAFFHIFNTLYNAHKQIVFSSDIVPSDMSGIAERLRSRLACGLVTDIHVPRLETKVAILKKKAEMSNGDLPDDVAHFIASRVISNIRELEGALIRVLAFGSLTHQAVTLELAKKILSYGESEKRTNIDFDRVVRVMAQYYPYDLDMLCAKNRSKDVALARHVAMYFMKKLTDKSLREIGQFLGGRNHATVMHALAKIEEQIKIDAQFQAHLENIESAIML